MDIKSEYYRSWEEYKEEFPNIANIENAEILQKYEEEFYLFILGLFL